MYTGLKRKCASIAASYIQRRLSFIDCELLFECVCLLYIPACVRVCVWLWQSENLRGKVNLLCDRGYTYISRYNGFSSYRSVFFYHIFLSLPTRIPYLDTCGIPRSHKLIISIETSHHLRGSTYKFRFVSSLKRPNVCVRNGKLLLIYSGRLYFHILAMDRGYFSAHVLCRLLCMSWSFWKSDVVSVYTHTYVCIIVALYAMQKPSFAY